MGFFLKIWSSESFLDKRMMDYIHDIAPKYMGPEEHCNYYNSHRGKAFNAMASSFVDFLLNYEDGIIAPNKYGSRPVKKIDSQDAISDVKEYLFLGLDLDLRRTKKPKYEVFCCTIFDESDIVTDAGDVIPASSTIVFPTHVYFTPGENSGGDYIFWKNLISKLSQLLKTEYVYLLDEASGTILFHAFKEPYNEYLNMSELDIEPCYYSKEIMSYLLVSSHVGLCGRLPHPSREIDDTLKTVRHWFDIMIETRNYYKYPLQVGLVIRPYDDEPYTEQFDLFEDERRIQYCLNVCKSDIVAYSNDSCFHLDVIRKSEWDHPRYGKAWLYTHKKREGLWQILYVSDFS